MSFKPKLRLKHLSAIAFATSLFNDSSVRSIMKKSIEDSQFIARQGRKSKEFVRLFKDIIKRLESLNLPENILHEIVYVIEPLFVRCIAWHWKIRDMIDFNYIHLDKFHWTCYGTVDTAKIVKEEWASWFDANGAMKENLIDRFQLPSNEVASPAVLKKLAMYYMACACIFKNYIEAHLKDILQLCDELIVLENASIEKIEYIIYSAYFLTGSKKQTLGQYQKKGIYQSILENIGSWEKENTFPVHMFSLSVRQRCEFAARYYWDLMNPDEKNDRIIPEALYCFKSPKAIFFMDVITFLIMQMSEDQRRELFLHPELVHNDSLRVGFYMKVFIDNCPWEEFFYRMFDILKERFSKRDLAYLLQEITQKITFMYREVGYRSKNTTHYKMFFAVFEEIRKHGKPHLIPTFSLGRDLVKLFDYEILRAVTKFECRDEKSKKAFLEPEYRNPFGKLVRANQFQEMDKFMEVVLFTDDERKWFKKYSKWHPDFVANGDFQALDNLLDWQCESEEERRMLKYNAVVCADLMGICGKFFVKDRMKEAEDAKKWGLSDQQYKEKYITGYKPSKLDWLNDTWETCLRESICYELGVEKAKSRTLEFLKWFLETDEAVATFKKKLTNRNIIINILSSFHNGISRCQVLNEFLIFCLSPEDLACFKETIYDHIQEWFRLLCGKEYLAIELNNFLEFVSTDLSKKEEAIKVFMNSEIRFTFFWSIFHCRDFEKSSHWLAKWIKLAVDRKEIDDYINEIASYVRSAPELQNKLNDLRVGIDALENDGKALG